MKSYCPDCKKELKYIEDDDLERDENYICKHCKSKWLIVYVGMED